MFSTLPLLKYFLELEHFLYAKNYSIAQIGTDNLTKDERNAVNVLIGSVLKYISI